MSIHRPPWDLMSYLFSQQSSLVPLTVAILSAIFPPNASIAVTAVAKLVAISILLPVIVGLAISSWFPGFARRAAAVAAMVGYAVLALLVAAVLYNEGGAIISLLGDGSLVAIVLTVVTAVVGGHLLGQPNPSQSRELAMAAAIRHPGIAALIAHQNFSDRRVMLAIILYLLASALSRRSMGFGPGTNRAALVMQEPRLDLFNSGHVLGGTMMKNLALLLTMPIACVYVTGAQAAQPMAVSESASTGQRAFAGSRSSLRRGRPRRRFDS